MPCRLGLGRILSLPRNRLRRVPVQVVRVAGVSASDGGGSRGADRVAVLVVHGRRLLARPCWRRHRARGAAARGALPIGHIEARAPTLQRLADQGFASAGRGWWVTSRRCLPCANTSGKTFLLRNLSTAWLGPSPPSLTAFAFAFGFVAGGRGAASVRALSEWATWSGETLGTFAGSAE